MLTQLESKDVLRQNAKRATVTIARCRLGIYAIAVVTLVGVKILVEYIDFLRGPFWWTGVLISFVGVSLLLIYRLHVKQTALLVLVKDIEFGFKQRETVEELLLIHSTKVDESTHKARAENLFEVLYVFEMQGFPVLAVLCGYNGEIPPHWYVERYKTRYEATVADIRIHASLDVTPNGQMSEYLTKQGELLKRIEESPTGQVLRLGKQNEAPPPQTRKDTRSTGQRVDVSAC